MAEVEIGIYKSARQATASTTSHRAVSAHARSRGRRHLLADRRLQVRLAGPRFGDGRGHVARHRDRARSPRGLGVLNLEGLWTVTRPDAALREIRELDDDKATARMQQMYLEPIKIELVAQRISEMKGAASPPRRRSRPRAPTGWPRPSWTPVSTSSSSRGPSSRRNTSRRPSSRLNLKKFIREFELPVIVGGCASYQAALHSCAPRRRCARGRGTGQRLHVARGARHRCSPGDRDRRRRRCAHAPPR